MAENITRAAVKALQVVDTLGMGGAETWLMEVLRLWARDGKNSMAFLITSGQRGVFDSEAEELGAKLHYVRFSRSDLPQFVRRFRAVLSEGNYDAIHDHQDFASGWHFLSGGTRLPRVRVTHVHNPSYQIRNNYGTSRLRRMTAMAGKNLIARYATHIAATSRDVLDKYGFNDRQFAHIPRFPLYCGFNTTRFMENGCDARSKLRNEMNWPLDSKVILFAGRMDESPDIGHARNHKNSGFAVDVVIEALRRNDNLRALFAGNPSAATAVLAQRVNSSGLSTRVKFAGLRNDVSSLMCGSDVLLFPSRAEGLGMVAVEAQAAGLPVLASRDVPREAVVVDSLVRFRDVSEGVGPWADDLIEMVDLARDQREANDAVAKSPFSVNFSSRELLRVYRGE